MMKNTKKLIAVLLVLMLSVSILASCGGGLSGTYSMTEIEDEGKLENYAEYSKTLKAMYDEMGLEFDSTSSIEFLKDGKCKFTMFGESVDATFKVDGKSLTVTYEEDEMKATIDGNKITFGTAADGDRMVFTKK